MTTYKQDKNLQVPKEVSYVTKTLENSGFEAYLIGGSVRDIILGRQPKDWDVATNARPEDIIKIFTKTFYENKFGTVGVVQEDASFENLKVIEVTPYRIESGYSDNRHPDRVDFSTKLEDDLKRRDFTINALAGHIKDDAIHEIIDMFGGMQDIKDKSLRTVGKATDRFEEDGLRILRAVRITTELGFSINTETQEAIVSCGTLLKNIAMERIQVEFSKILMSDSPIIGVNLAQKLGILKFIAPELEQGIGVEQNQAHSFDVWEHLLRSLQHAADQNWPLEIRLAALFHDIAKPETRRFSHETKQWTFYGHEVVGSRVTRKILERLKYPKKTIDKVTTLVRWHMFMSDTETISLAAVRRMIVNVGPENIWDLMNLRICDRIGTGRPKANPYRLRKYKAMIEEALRAPLTVSTLKLNGKELMEVLGEAPGPKIGYILHALLEEVIEKPELNTREYLEQRSKDLNKLSIEDLKKLGELGKHKKEEVEAENIEEIRKKYGVK
ncbi:MAG: CCA tRNA nucleotidyltransferase [Patescibacteria group bacterium]